MFVFVVVVGITLEYMADGRLIVKQQRTNSFYMKRALVALFKKKKEKKRKEKA